MKKTCFVITGYGPKTDLTTGRVLDLDKTFEHLIKPVFEELEMECFRSKDIKHSGIIDVPMYEWIYKADIVVADISTLNPNALYELGVRHALKPFTTIVISEKELKYPFDVNHTIIENYEHLGPDIGVSEAKRFTHELKEKVKEVLKNQRKDSPVYIFLPKLYPPSFTEEEIEEIKEASQSTGNFSDLLEKAEKAKNNGEYLEAIKLFKECLKFDENNPFLIQRLALAIYKSEKPNPIKALQNAEKELQKLSPELTTDPETLGLSGAINKRLHKLKNDIGYLDKAIWFYRKGFYIANDYYNGINTAFLLNKKALLESDAKHSVSYYYQANEIRQAVVKICEDLINNENFKDRHDKQWVYQSLAQAYLGLGEEKNLIPKIQKYSQGLFDIRTFNDQNSELIQILDKFKQKNII